MNQNDEKEEIVTTCGGKLSDPTGDLSAIYLIRP